MSICIVYSEMLLQLRQFKFCQFGRTIIQLVFLVYLEAQLQYTVLYIAISGP